LTGAALPLLAALLGADPAAEASPASGSAGWRLSEGTFAEPSISVGLLACTYCGLDGRLGLSLRWRGVLVGAFGEGAVFPGMPSTAGSNVWGYHTMAGGFAGVMLESSTAAGKLHLPAVVELGAHWAHLRETASAGAPVAEVARTALLPFLGLRAGVGGHFDFLPLATLRLEVVVRHDLGSGCLQLMTTCEPTGWWSFGISGTVGLDLPLGDSASPEP